jgi:dTDP-4-dehydrorhamnose reductase
MDKILITGGYGFFASRFKDFYSSQYDILAVDKDILDIQDEEKVMNFIKNYKPEYIIHTAAIASTGFCNKNPEIAHSVNVKGTVNVAKAAKEAGSKLVFISTEQVFNGNKDRGPYTEDDKANPDTVYGQNKLEAEEKIREIIDELWVLRFTWLFGLPERGKGINPNIVWGVIKSLQKGEKIDVSDNEYRGLTYVYDLLGQFSKIFDLPYDTYHVGSKNEYSRYEIVNFILEELGLEERIEKVVNKNTEKYAKKARDIRLNTDKIRGHGVKFLDTKEAIKKCLSDFNYDLK